MPKETFLNLSEDKKQRIYEAAVEEFSQQRFSEASINKIIKHAEIPRGSFYQYFQDKEDIYLYMYERISNEKRDIVHRTEGINRDADIFEASLSTVRATFEWSRLNPRYIQIGILMEIDNSEFITKLRAASSTAFGKLVDRDKAHGLIRQDIDSELVGDMIYTLIWKQFSLVGSDEELFYKKLKEGLKVIREGIAGV